jgi:amino acid adenylation domain-containing protein
MKSKMLNHQPRLNIATTLVQQFETTVKQSSNHSALISPRKQLSYQQLNEQANQVAAQLQRLAIHSEQFIGLHLELSIEAVIGLWGILKAGGAFVPIDPSYPPDRIQHILNETQISIILTSRAGAGGLPSHQAKRLYVDELSTDSLIENHQSKVENPSHLACCLYTSGSTGQPKGVLLEHQALVKHFTSLQQHYQLTPADRVLQFASLTHIAGVEQIIMALLSGATLIVPEQKLWTVSEFLPKVKQYGLTMVDLPASYYQTLAQEWVTSRTTLQDSPLRLLIVGGEVTSTEGGMLWSKLAASNIHFLNVYGMTEVSGTATLFEMPTHFSQNWHSLPIGQALPNRTIYLMDEPLRPVPDGENGEICIGGASLARGYLNQPVLTAEKFVVNPVGEGRLYRTGDLGRFLPDGNLEYLGRKDYQVQIRGFRVELGEIEAALLTHPTVKEAVVMAHGEGANKQLAAYAVCQNTVNNTPMQSFWQPDEQYKNEKGVLTNLTERMAFKLQQNNLRSDLTSQIKLQKPITDEIKQQYLIRQSYRQFVNKAISLQSLTQFLNCLYPTKSARYAFTQIPLSFSVGFVCRSKLFLF